MMAQIRNAGLWILPVIVLGTAVCRGQFRPPKQFQPGQKSTSTESPKQQKSEAPPVLMPVLPQEPVVPADSSQNKAPTLAPVPTGEPAEDGTMVRLTLPKAHYADTIAAAFSGGTVSSWSERVIRERTCLVSPVIDGGAGNELNHYRLTATFGGDGTVQAAVVHGRQDDLDALAVKGGAVTPFAPLVSGKTVTIHNQYRQEQFAWVLLSIEGYVDLQSLNVEVWRGYDTAYGHAPGEFEFAGGTLPFRLMYPEHYDPEKQYPLVLSVPGSGGVGNDNVKSMEMTVPGRFFFTTYYDDPWLACFSLITQIPADETIPSVYWPKGFKGRPNRIHPDWPAVNADGWYAQASIALVRTLMQEKLIPIDPNRLYFAGFSYGGKACWEFLKAAPDLFAAAMCTAGWAIGPAYSDPDARMLEALAYEVSMYKHVPVRIFAGADDPMRFNSKAVNDEILKQGGDSAYVEFPGAGHVPSSGKTWANRDYIAWLFQQRSEPAKDDN